MWSRAGRVLRGLWLVLKDGGLVWGAGAGLRAWWGWYISQQCCPLATGTGCLRGCSVFSRSMSTRAAGRRRLASVEYLYPAFRDSPLTRQAGPLRAKYCRCSAMASVAAFRPRRPVAARAAHSSACAQATQCSTQRQCVPCSHGRGCGITRCLRVHLG